MYAPKYTKHTPNARHANNKRHANNTRHTKRKKISPWQEMLFFPASIFYSELLIRIFDKDISFFSGAFFRVLFFSAAAGLLIHFLLSIMPWHKVSRGIAIGLLATGAVILCVQFCCKGFFRVYFPFLYVLNMSGQAAGDFSGNIIDVILNSIPFILLSLLPLAIFIIFRKRFYVHKTTNYLGWVSTVVLIVVLQLLGVMTSNTSGIKPLYTYDFSTNNAVSEFGLLTTLRLEVQYAIFGSPAPPELSLDLPPDPLQTDPSGPNSTVDPTSPEVTEPPVIEYGFNSLDSIDFEALIDSTSNKTLLSMHKYFNTLTPSQKNEFTGRFKGKNLILITAEAFSPYVISEELTPTLYRLTHESFVFNNYYQPNWGQSTSGGEFAVMTGVIPMWINSSTAFVASIGNNMSTCLGWLFQEEGYSALAYHNNSHTYYSRNKTHPNLGYDFSAIGNGLELPSNNWPRSDLEMMQATVDEYIQDYLSTGQNFHAYYMTVSGHALYNWGGNSMSRKYKEIVQQAYPDYSDTVQAYIACNLDLEYALEYLVQRLEDAGIADDTVIVLSADHYPYGMIENGKDYYNELTGLNDSESDISRYENTLIMWCGDGAQTVVVDTPCSAIDIVPTLLNLFGIDYDSRLYSGRDIFATNYVENQASTCMPLVILPNTGGNSWITAAGTYDASTKTFTPNPGIEVDEDYVSNVKTLVQAKITYAKYTVQQDYYDKVLD